MQQTSPHKPVTSRDNQVIKYLRSLSDPKHRKKEQAFLIEGVKMVEEALRDSLGVKMVIAAPTLVQHHGRGVLKLAENRAVDILWISERLMDQIAESKTPQPVMAVVTMRGDREQELLENGSGVVIIVHQLQDPGNLGTLIRTAEAAGAAGIALTAGTVDPFNAKSVRASMGSVLRLPIVPVADIGKFIKACRHAGFQIVAAALTGEKTHFDVDLGRPTAVIVGQEGSGLPQDVMAEVDLRVRIPMAETIDSLNVATSVAVILYEAMRQRTRRPEGSC
ncbi:MAG TPA: RNA methyltransferase [Nitrospirota bacterium]